MQQFGLYAVTKPLRVGNIVPHKPNSNHFKQNGLNKRLCISLASRMHLCERVTR